MHFDALTLACVTHELNQTVVPGRVQGALLVDEQTVGLELYANRQRRYLLLSANPQASRVHLVDHKLRRGTGATPPLLLLLRKYVRGALLESITQLAPWERVLQLAFNHPEHGTTTLVVETMGRAANLMLLDATGKMLDVTRRVPPSERTVRPLLPGRPYVPPAAPDKIPPLDNGDPGYYGRLAAVSQHEGKLWRAIVATVTGISPTQGRELAWRIAGDADAPAKGVEMLAVAQALQALWSPLETGEWEPGTLVRAGEFDNEIIGFAPYRVHFLAEADFVPAQSMSEALAQFYGESSQASVDEPGEAEQIDAYAALRANVANLLKQARKQTERRLAALDKDEPAPGEPAQLRTRAEWLLALSSQITPEQEVLDVDLGEETLSIRLNAKQTPVEQAERMFKRASKLERAAKIIPQRRAKLRSDLEFVEQLEVDLSQAENQPEIAAVEGELRGAGVLGQRGKAARAKREKRSGAVAGPRSFNSPSGFAILVGRNARQNDDLTFRRSHPQDLWLHARDVPGSHVVIRSSGREVDEATVEMAARLAAYFSKLRGERSAPVMLAERRFVTRVPGGRPGQVYVRNDGTVTVEGTLPTNVRKE